MADRALLPLRNLDKKTMMDMVDKAMVDSAMVYLDLYNVLEPGIEKCSTSSDDSDDGRSFEKTDKQLHALSSQENSSDSIIPSSHGSDTTVPFSQQSNPGFGSSQNEPSRISQELLAETRRMEKWEEEMKEMLEKERREFDEEAQEMERREREYRTLGFDTREEEMRFLRDREEERRKIEE